MNEHIIRNLLLENKQKPIPAKKSLTGNGSFLILETQNTLIVSLG
jgi:hypothetical protein